MSENPGGTPPRDDEPAKAAEPVEPPTAPDPVAAPVPDPAPAVPPAPPAPPVPPAPPAPSYGQPPAGPPPAPAYGQPPAGYPPQASPYGQPAPGGYPPPPPPPGYGQGAPGAYPPPAGGYGAPVQASPIGEAYSYGWKKFTQSGGLFILAALVWFIAAIILLSIVGAIFGGFGALFYPDGDMSAGLQLGFSLGTFVFSAVAAIAGYLIQAAFIRAALDVTEGRQLSFGDFFKIVEPGPVILTALILAVVNAVLNAVPFFGGLVALAVNFLLLFTFWFVIDKHLAPIDAMKASYQLVTANLSTTILFYLLSIAIFIGGAILCGVGLLVAVPVVLLATAFLFKRLLGDPIAA